MDGVSVRTRVRVCVSRLLGHCSITTHSHCSNTASAYCLVAVVNLLDGLRQVVSQNGGFGRDCGGRPVQHPERIEGRM